MPLRLEHRWFPRRARSRRLRDDAVRRRPLRGQSLHLLPGQRQAHRRAGPRRAAQPGSRRQLHAANPCPPVPRHAARRRAESLSVRDGQHPQSVFVGALQRQRSCHRQGQGSRSDGGGPGGAAGAAAHVRRPRREVRPGGRWGSCRDDGGGLTRRSRVPGAPRRAGGHPRRERAQRVHVRHREAPS